MGKVLDFIASNETVLIERLREAVEIPSVSCWPDHRGHCIRQMEVAEKQLNSLNVITEKVEIGNQKLRDGSEIPLPPIILGSYGNDPNKKTLLVYGHLDVQPAMVSDGWDTEPFKLIEKDGKLYGRGSTDDKGPVLGWINALEAYQKTGTDFPINIKFCLEGMEESGSVMLEETVRARTDFFATNVDWVCISDNYFLGKEKPCLTYGLRGCAYFFVEVTCAKQDLHSGVFGGSIPEAMTEISHIFSSLIDIDGTIKIPGLSDEVDPVTDAEKKRYENIDFSLEGYRKELEAGRLLSDDKKDLLMRRWRFPSLSIHGIHGAFAEPGEKTVIPGHVTGKFSIRLVPSMTPEHVEKVVVDHVMQIHEKLNTENKVKCYAAKGVSVPWVTNPDNENFTAAAEAIKKVHGVEPDFTREGCSIPVTLVFEEVTGKNVLLLPLGACDDGAHSQNEKINKGNYIQGSKVLAQYIYQLGKL